MLFERPRTPLEAAMKSKYLVYLVAVASLLGASSTVAQESSDVYDRVDLSASAEREIDNDLLVAVVFAEVQANRQSEAAAQVNESIQWAVNRARRVSAVELQTMQYNTRPVYANGRRIVGWVARQSLRLESEDGAVLSDLLGDLQERVAIQSVSYDVSKQARDAAEEMLIAEALRQFDRRAALVARELGRDGFRIVRISINPTFAGPLQRVDAVTATASAAQPAIEAGTRKVSVFVSGTVELGQPALNAISSVFGSLDSISSAVIHCSIS
jgi:predicted secreted protein